MEGDYFHAMIESVERKWKSCRMKSILMRGMTKRSPLNIVQSHFARILPNASSYIPRNERFSIFEPLKFLQRAGNSKSQFDIYPDLFQSPFLSGLSPLDAATLSRANQLAGLMSAQRVGRLSRLPNGFGGLPDSFLNLSETLKYNNGEGRRLASGKTKEIALNSSISGVNKKNGTFQPLRCSPGNQRSASKSKSSVKYANVDSSCGNSSLLDVDFKEYDDPAESFSGFVHAGEDAMDEDVDTQDAAGNGRAMSRSVSQDGRNGESNFIDRESCCKYGDKRRNFSLKSSLKKWISTSIFKSKSGLKPLCGDWNEVECKWNSSRSSFSGKNNPDSDSSQCSLSEQCRPALATGAVSGCEAMSDEHQSSNCKTNLQSIGDARFHHHHPMPVSSPPRGSTLSCSSLTALSSPSSSSAAKGNHIFSDHSLEVKLKAIFLQVKQCL